MVHIKGPSSLLFATAGIPISTPKPSILTGIAHLQALGLDGMELEFVHSVNVSEKNAPLVAQAAKENGVWLTCHGQYYINLFSLDEEKRVASAGRVVNAAQRASQCGAWSVTFHPAFYQGQDPQKVYDGVKDQLIGIVRRLQDESVSIWVRPETTGKPTQFGSLQELLRLSAELEMVMPCIDFSHLHARTNGAFNTPAEFRQVLQEVEKHLGNDGLSNMHIHLSGINYGEKGEKNHLPLEESDMRWRELLAVWKEFKVKGIVVCESPNIEQDALMLKKFYGKVC